MLAKYGSYDFLIPYLFGRDFVTEDFYIDGIYKENTEDNILYFIEMPGVKKKDLSIEIKNKFLIIEAIGKIGKKEIKYSKT